MTHESVVTKFGIHILAPTLQLAGQHNELSLHSRRSSDKLAHG